MRNMLGIALVLAALALNLGKLPFPPVPPVDPVDPVLPEVEIPKSVRDALESGFSSKKPEAATWSGLLAGMARAIEQDQAHPEGPRLKTMLDVDGLRKWAVKCPPIPVAGGESIGQALGPEFTKLGISNESLEEAGRRAAVVKLLDSAAQLLAQLGGLAR
jgi:hypothetical protein